MRFLSDLRRVLVAGNGPLWIAGNRLVHPLDPLGRVQPPVAQLNQPSGILWATAIARGASASLAAWMSGVRSGGNGNVSNVVLGV